MIDIRVAFDPGRTRANAFCRAITSLGALVEGLLYRQGGSGAESIRAAGPLAVKMR